MRGLVQAVPAAAAPAQRSQEQGILCAHLLLQRLLLLRLHTLALVPSLISLPPRVIHLHPSRQSP